MTVISAAKMSASFRLVFGGEDVQKLQNELRRSLPASRLSEERAEEDACVRLLWEHPAQTAYGEDCFATWKAFQTCVRRAFGRAADEDLYGVRFCVYVDDNRSGRLERSEDAGGVRDHLAGEPLHCGDGVDVLMPDGTWMAGRYELSHGSDGEREPFFYFAVWGGEGCLAITSSMVLRPSKR